MLVITRRAGEAIVVPSNDVAFALGCGERWPAAKGHRFVAETMQAIHLMKWIVTSVADKRCEAGRSARGTWSAIGCGGRSTSPIRPTIGPMCTHSTRASGYRTNSGMQT